MPDDIEYLDDEYYDDYDICNVIYDVYRYYPLLDYK